VRFLQRRRDRLSADEIEHYTDEALRRWLTSPRMRYRGKR
jgi:hypothetical protein